MAQSENRTEIHVFINGQKHVLTGEKAFLPLAQYLRCHSSLPGTKVVCAEGDCGACTVLVSKLKNSTWSRLQTINSCIAPMYLFDLASLITVEGLSKDDELNEVQDRMREFHGGQCGYCTPGMVCALSSLAESSACSGKSITEKKARNHLTGNLCRCTGYEPILKAATHIDLSRWSSLAARYQTTEMAEDLTPYQQNSVQISINGRSLVMPVTWDSATSLKALTPLSRVVAGATDLGVLHNKGKSFLDSVMVLSKIEGVDTIKETSEGIWIGACVTLSQFEEFLETQIPEMSRLMRIFASPQIKNQGTVLGNVMNGSPIGDSIPGLMALDANLYLRSQKGLRTVPLTQFYKAYKVFDLSPDEVAEGLMIPKLDANWRTKFFKVSLRKDLDISAVTFAAALRIESGTIKEARIAMGGVGPTVQRLSELEADLKGQRFEEVLFKEVGKKVRTLIKPISDLRASEEYRLQVAENLFRKCHFELQQELSACP